MAGMGFSGPNDLIFDELRQETPAPRTGREAADQAIAETKRIHAERRAAEAAIRARQMSTEPSRDMRENDHGREA